MPSAVFENNKPMELETEKATVVCRAFKAASENKLKTQFYCLVVGLILITVCFVVFFFNPKLFYILIGCVAGLAIALYGLTLKPDQILSISKVYTTAFLVPYENQCLLFDANGLVGDQTFTYTSMPQQEMAEKLKQLPNMVSLENENRLTTLFRELNDLSRQARTNNPALPIVARGHTLMSCINAADKYLVDGISSQILKKRFEIDKAVEYAKLLYSLEKSKDVIDFLKYSQEICDSRSVLFIKQLEQNIGVIQKYLEVIRGEMEKRLFGNFSYRKKQDPDVDGVLTYEVLKTPDFVNIVKPFQPLIDTLYLNVRREVDKIKTDFETTKNRLQRELESQKRRIDSDKEREIARLDREIDSAKREADSLGNRRRQLKYQLDEERSRQSGRKYPDYSYCSTLEADIKDLDAQRRRIEDKIEDTERGKSEEVERCEQEKRQFERDFEHNIKIEYEASQKNIKSQKSPVLRMQAWRDKVIDMAYSTLGLIETERQIQCKPYELRRNNIKSICGEVLSRLEKETGARTELINQIKRFRQETEVKTPTQICLPFWLVTIQRRDGVEKLVYSAMSVIKPSDQAKSWFKDCVEFTAPVTPFDAYIEFLQNEEVFAQAHNYTLQHEGILQGANDAKFLREYGAISNRFYEKMIQYFGGKTK